MILLDLMKLSEVRIAGDRSNWLSALSIKASNLLRLISLLVILVLFRKVPS